MISIRKPPIATRVDPHPNSKGFLGALALGGVAALLAVMNSKKPEPEKYCTDPKGTAVVCPADIEELQRRWNCVKEGKNPSVQFETKNQVGTTQVNVGDTIDGVTIEKIEPLEGFSVRVYFVTVASGISKGTTGGFKASGPCEGTD